MSSFKTATPKTLESANARVYIYTLITYTLLILLLFIKFVNKVDEVKIVEDAMEVNLGEDKTGLGEEAVTSVASNSSSSNMSQPQQITQANTQPSHAVKSPTETTTDIDENIASVIKKEQTKPSNDSRRLEQKIINEAESQETPEKPKEKLKETPQEKPQPMAIFGGNNNTNDDQDGSSYDSYGKNSSQGISGGKGDEGAKNGSMYSNNYGSSVSVVGGLGNRKVMGFSQLNNDFDSEGIVNIKVSFDRNGKMIRAQQDIASSTTTKKQLVDIALKYIQNIKLSPDQNSAFEQVVTFRFIFKLNL